MTLALRSATAPKVTLGAGVGLRAVVRAVGLPPWWLYVPGSRWERKYDVHSIPSSRAVDSCIALLAALLVVVAAATIRRRRDVAAGALIGFVLCGALAAVAASTPTPRVLSATLGYTMWWGSQVGMWVWLMLAWSGWLGLAWLARALARMAAERRGRSRRPLAARAPWISALVRLSLSLLACVASLAATAAVGVAVAATGKPDEHQYLYRATSKLAARLDRTIPPDGTIELLGSLNVATMPIRPALRYVLVRHDVHPMTPGSYRRLGDWYELYDRPYQEVAYVEDGTRAPAQGARLLDRVRFASDWGPQTVSLWLSSRADRRPEVHRKAPGIALKGVCLSDPEIIVAPTSGSLTTSCGKEKPSLTAGLAHRTEHQPHKVTPKGALQLYLLYGRYDILELAVLRSRKAHQSQPGEPHDSDRTQDQGPRMAP
jgi:hypothetical protein